STKDYRGGIDDIPEHGAAAPELVVSVAFLITCASQIGHAICASVIGCIAQAVRVAVEDGFDIRGQVRVGKLDQAGCPSAATHIDIPATLSIDRCAGRPLLSARIGAI